MLIPHTQGKLTTIQHLRLFKTLFSICGITAFLIYALMQVFSLGISFTLNKEMTTLLTMPCIAALYAGSCHVFCLITHFSYKLIARRRASRFWGRGKQAVLLTGVSMLLISCNTTPLRVGIKKDFDTGMSTSYKGMEPAQAFLVMNNEVLRHTDIPLGESFLVVNNGITGLTAKNGKVKLGCALSITDKNGTELINEKDLFEGRDEFSEQEAKMLKCTVNTGNPMQWEESYKVNVTFWDKNGDGKIENSLTIKSIDIP